MDRTARPVRRALAAAVAAIALAASADGPLGATGASPAPGPPVGALFDYQLQTGASGPGGIDLGLCARVGPGPCLHPRVWDIDLYGPDGTTPNSAAVRAIHRRGGYAVCYVDAGTWESWRPDAARFPRSLLGRSNGWPGERWLDVRALGPLLAIMASRVGACARAGFDAVDFDNVDGYANRTGFAITPADQLRYDRALAALAHRDHLAAGLKNDRGQVAALASSFDFAVDEQCVAYHECARLAPFVRAHRAVYDVEYRRSRSTCAPVAGVRVVVQGIALRATPWRPCP